jgi:hypothetical protein
MSYNIINEALADIPNLRRNSTKFKKVQYKANGNLDGVTEIYSLGIDDLHIKLVVYSDSYGNEESVRSIQIVKPKVVKITDFEVI